MSVECFLPPDKASVIQVIHLAAMRGAGMPENPARLANFYFSLDGRLLPCQDPINGAPDGFIVPQPARPDACGEEQKPGVPSRIPPRFQAATVRYVTPVDGQRREIGVEFEFCTGGRMAVRLRTEDAAELANMLNQYSGELSTRVHS